MSKERNTVLAGIAALALFAGVSIASAQDTQDQNKGPQGNPPAAQQMNKGPSAGRTGQSTQKQQPGKMGQNQQTEQHPTAQSGKMQAGNSAQRTHMNNRAAMRERNRRTTAEHNRMQRPSTAQQQPNRPQQFGEQPNGQQQFGERPRNGLEGLQGNAAGGTVQLSEEQRAQIRTGILNAPNAPRVGNVDFPIVAGTVIPRGAIQIVPVPPPLVQIDPAWRHYSYFVWNDQLIIVNPRDMRIVAVVFV